MTAKKVLAVTSLTVVIAFAGCATANHVDYAPTNPAPLPLRRRAPDAVSVFVGAPASRPHVDLGIFEVYQGQTESGRGRSTEDMLATLKMHASLLGCDAVQMLGIELVGRYGSRVVRGACEVYTDDEARRAAAASPASDALPGEGTPCGADGGRAQQQASSTPCPDPLVCENRICVSPYR